MPPPPAPEAGVAHDAEAIHEVRARVRAEQQAANWPSRFQRLRHAALAWAPLALMVGYGGPVVADCQQVLGDCPSVLVPGQALVAALLLGLLLAAPRIAYAGALATSVLVVGAVALLFGAWLVGAPAPQLSAVPPWAIGRRRGLALVVSWLAVATWLLADSQRRPWSAVRIRRCRCRIAPSPTGPLHIGTARTALFNYLFARHVGGTFILRLEDTDVARNTLDYERDILDGLHWLGLEWDEGPEVPACPPADRSARIARCSGSTAIAAAAAERLLAEDKAYPATARPMSWPPTAPPRRPPTSRRTTSAAAPADAEQRAARGRGRGPVIRFRVGEGVVAFDDLVRGHVEIDTSALGGDLVIVRSDGTPLYHFTSSSTTSRWRSATSSAARTTCPTRPSTSCSSARSAPTCPAFAHLPLILNPTGPR
jgi:hypothetical protein